MPDTHVIATLVLIVLALFLFTRDRIPLETSSLVIFTVLVIGFQLFPYERDGVQLLHPADFFSGFGHEALITIAALLICGKALEATGALQPIGRFMAAAWSANRRLAFLVTLIIAAALSAFLNNTPIVVMLLPILVGVAIRTKTPSSQILMPVGLATIVGGMATTIGTSTNLLVVAIAADLGTRRLEMFDFTVPVVFAGFFGIIYLWLVAPRLLPNREPLLTDTSPRVYTAMLHVNEDSFAAGKTLVNVLSKTNNRMRIERIERGDGLFVVKLPSLTIQPGDRLYVNDTPENLKEFEQSLGATLFNVTDAEHPISEEFPLSSEGQQLAEVVVTPGSPLYQRTLKSVRFVARYRLLPLAIHRPRSVPSDATTDISDEQLRSADIILVQGSRDNIQELRRSGHMLILDGSTDLPHTRRAPLASIVMALVVLTAAMGFLPISVSALAGAGILLVTRCLDWRDALESLNIKVVMIIVTSLALGRALTTTGGADFIAQSFVTLVSGQSVPVILSGFILLMSAITNIVSNNAAAVIGTPIAIGIAHELGVAPEAFVLAVLFGANMSFATPIGYQTNLLVLSAGGYRFNDFIRVGVPLTLIVWLAYSFILPNLYGLA